MPVNKQKGESPAYTLTFVHFEWTFLTSWHSTATISIYIVSVFYGSCDLIQTLIESLLRTNHGSISIRHQLREQDIASLTSFIYETVIVSSCRVCWSFSCTNYFSFRVKVRALGRRRHIANYEWGWGVLSELELHIAVLAGCLSLEVIFCQSELSLMERKLTVCLGLWRGHPSLSYIFEVEWGNYSFIDLLSIHDWVIVYN